MMPRTVPQPVQPKKQVLFDLGILDDVFIMKAYITKNTSFSGDNKTFCKESGPQVANKNDTVIRQVVLVDSR